MENNQADLVSESLGFAENFTRKRVDKQRIIIVRSGDGQ